MIARLAAFILALALSTAASSCATSQDTSSKTPMTVADVIENIEALQGQTVRMRGEVNNCTSLTCSICDGPAREDACLGLHLLADTDRASDTVEELYRFATITIDAHIDGLCLLGYDTDRFKSKTESDAHAAKSDRHVVVICTDRATSVHDARVVSVDARKPATLGRFDMYIGEPLTEASDDQYQRVQSFLKQIPWNDETDTTPRKLYPNPDPVSEAPVEEYILCTCVEDDCTGRWPTTSGHAFTRSPANPYYCQTVDRIGDLWVISS